MPHSDIPPGPRNTFLLDYGTCFCCQNSQHSLVSAVRLLSPLGPCLFPPPSPGWTFRA